MVLDPVCAFWRGENVPCARNQTMIAYQPACSLVTAWLCCPISL
jgi:hypothetical protein